MAISRAYLVPQCTARTSASMAKIGALAPRTRYLGRQINLDAQGHVDSGVVRTLCSFLTASGFERELEIPVIIHQGEIIDPALAVVGGNPVLLTPEFIDGISKAGTISEKMTLGSIYSTAYAALKPGDYRELSNSLAAVPRLYRPLF